MPIDFIADILSRLAVKSVVCSSCISKLWAKLIKAEIHQYPLQALHQQVTTTVDYYNGLVCLHNCDEEITLWNPLIRKYKKLPSEPVQKRCTLITRSKDSDAPLHSILACDFAKENFRVYKTLLQQIEYDNRKTCLGVLGGCRCYVVNVWKMYNEVWLMKEYGEESSWIQVYKTDLRANTIASNLNSDLEYLNVYLKPLKFSRHGKKVLLVDCKNIFWYDIEKKRSKRLESQNLTVVFTPLTFIGSLLLLDGDSVIDPKEKKRKK
ncbi:F-box protein At4g22390-like [Castanea sativa]|uniref:F-box protein At4g22390-like n=1 Tax=Castanea sativa TaxID=21020 RepID=UPI003F651A87